MLVAALLSTQNILKMHLCMRCRVFLSRFSSFLSLSNFYRKFVAHLCIKAAKTRQTFFVLHKHRGNQENAGNEKNLHKTGTSTCLKMIDNKLPRQNKYIHYALTHICLVWKRAKQGKNQWTEHWMLWDRGRKRQRKKASSIRATYTAFKIT